MKMQIHKKEIKENSMKKMVKALMGLVLLAALALTGCPAEAESKDGSADMAALNTAISEAEAAKTGVVAAAGEADVPEGTKWVTPSVMKQLDDAIIAAKALVKKEAASQSDVDETVVALTNIVKTFNDSKQDGTAVEPEEIVYDIVDLLDLTELVPAPAAKKIPATSLTTSQYTGSIDWKNAGDITADWEVTWDFLQTTEYMAIVTLTAAEGYTFTGVGAAGFIHSGGTVSNEADSGIVTITFPSTGPEPAAGTHTTYTGGAISFNMAYVPGGITFPLGSGDRGDSGGTTATVSAAYEIGETEVTYQLWDEVKRWAEALPEARKYSFYNEPGKKGSSGTGTDQEPVTTVTWFDAVVWCNALTEWYNENNNMSLMPVYYSGRALNKVAKNSDYTNAAYFEREISNQKYGSAFVDPNATGFRLPMSIEWELAARWQGTTDRGNSVSREIEGTTFYFTKGNSASGATASYTDTAATQAVAWYDENSGGGTKPVKGKAANVLGLYDMSGNVAEWSYNWPPKPNQKDGAYRVIRGSSWVQPVLDIELGWVVWDTPDRSYYSFWYSTDPYYAYGFRISRSPAGAGDSVDAVSSASRSE
jgi:formylglycine-generating enzyme required for sulfatase activity